MDQNEPTEKAITVAVNTLPGNLEMLGIAAEFAAKMEATLDALFIEDTGLLRLAELPFSTELNRISGEVQELSQAKLISAMRTQVERMEKLLTSYREKKKVQTQLRIVRGNYLTEIAQAQSNILFASIGQSAHDVLSKSRTSLLVKGQTSSNTLPVWAFISEDPENEKVLRLSLELAALLRTGLVLAYPKKNPPDLVSFDTLLRERQNVPIQHQLLDSDFPDSAKQYINTHCSFLVVSKQYALNTLVSIHNHAGFRPPMIWVS